ncbi:MAG TPA: alpha-N-acetylglucosaminidase C-terminal domain-containing protein, partial [Pirellulales bacterium]|nr:alpha-N-acetylglucosaminidase C-terminal domain-containing protein [Pirellulales bacterium]
MLSNLAGPLAAQVASAHDAKDLAAYRVATRKFLELIDDMDDLVSTQESTLLGKWLKDAKSLATNDAERKLYEWNARTQITLWGPPNGILRDYAVKEWGGMLRGFYGERWRRFFAALETSMTESRPFDAGRFDRELRAWEDQWTRQTDLYPAAPSGDAVAISRTLLTKYVPIIEVSYRYEQNLTTGKPVTASGGSQPGHPPQMAVDGIADRSSAWWAAPWPQWLQVDLEKTVRIGSIDLFTYWDGGRSYQYTVETSLDGKTWTKVVDMSGNTKPATADGDHHIIQPTDARCVRVNMLRNSANEGVHIAEIRLYPAKEAALNLIPWPKSVELTGGEVVLTKDTRIVCKGASLLPLGEILADEIARTAGFRPAVMADASRPGDISLGFDPKLKDEAYELTVADRAVVRGADYNAIATGTVTLLQAISVRPRRVTLPHLRIADQPGLKYRAAMLDIARKPHSLAALRQCVEIARFYKIRYIHLHMSDENAWTFPSTKYPQLGKNNFAWAGGEKPCVYSVQELKELVAYGDARGVTFVPEIETPGHSGQLRGTMPEIFGYKTADGKIESPGVINIASDEALAALDDLVGEFAAVFKSSPYIHIGCDESSVGGIEKYSAVKARMAKMHLHNDGEVFTDYINRMAAIVKKHGKQTIVWQDAPVGPTT